MIKFLNKTKSPKAVLLSKIMDLYNTTPGVDVEVDNYLRKTTMGKQWEQALLYGDNPELLLGDLLDYTSVKELYDAIKNISGVE